MSTIKVNTIQTAAGTGSLTVPAESGTVVTTASPSLGRRNLIINGAMQVAQRGTSFASAGAYSLDRWRMFDTGSGAYTVSQDSNAPTGFNSSLKVLVNTTAAVGSTDLYCIKYGVEGYDARPLAYGSADAQDAVLSFYVRSSAAGTFGGSVKNSGGTLSYPFTYTVSSADTWERITVAISGETSGSWATTNSEHIQIYFGLGVGSSLKSTAGSWLSGNYFDATGTNDLITSASATWYITGVQLEVGSVATPFEHRSYGEELALCQRYLYKSGYNASSSGAAIGSGVAYASTSMLAYISFPVEMRAIPSVSYSGELAFRSAVNSTVTSSLTINNGSVDSTCVSATIGSTTAGQGGVLRTNTAGSYVLLDAEL